MQQLSTSDDEPCLVTQHEAHLLARLKILLAARARDMRVPHLRRDAALVRENRRLIRDCITKLRQVRAGVSSTWLGLGQREARRD